jgi:hypothetical protein
MNFDKIDEMSQRFLVGLCEATDGNSDIQQSTTDIGAQMDIDRATASQAAEYLIGLGYVEIRTLSGGIGITKEGVSKAREWGAKLSTDASTPRLNADPVVNETGRQAVEITLDAVKTKAGHLGLDYEKLSELVADLRTIEAQMSSPFPKSEIIRQAFLSIKEILNTTDATECVVSINDLLGL